MRNLTCWAVTLLLVSSAGCSADRVTNELDLSKSYAIEDTGWPADSRDEYRWQPKLRDGSLVVKLPNGIQLTGAPERFYIAQRDGRVFQLWFIFKRSDLDDVKLNIQRLLTELGLPSEQILKEIDSAPLGKSSFRIVYEKHINSDDTLVKAGIDAVSIMIQKSPYDDKPAVLHFEVYIPDLVSDSLGSADPLAK